jgi:hypothetical protein
MIRSKVGYLWRRFRAGVAVFLRNVWAQVTAPPSSMPGGPRWTGQDYDAAKIEREEGLPVPPEPSGRPGPTVPPMR